MYFRICLFLISLIAFNVDADWDQNQFDVGILTSQINVNHQLATSNESNLGLTAKAIQLYDGWGFSVANTSLYTSVKSDKNHTFHNRNSAFQFKGFITDNTDILFGIQDSSELDTAAILSTHFLDKPKNQLIATAFNLKANLNLGNDQDYWYIKFALNNTHSESEDPLTDNIFSTIDNDSLDLSLGWKITEDSYLTSKLMQVEGSNTQEQGENSSSILSSFVGFRTRYLGSSSLSVDLGSSAVKGGQNTLSWIINHKTELTEYSSITLANGRRYSVSGDYRFNNELQTNTKLNFAIKPTNYLSLLFDVNYITGVIGGAIDSEKLSIKNAYNLAYSSNWSSNLYVQYDEYKDDRSIFDYEQTVVGISVSRDLI